MGSKSSIRLTFSILATVVQFLFYVKKTNKKYYPAFSRMLMFLILKISKKDFHCCWNSMHVNWNRFQSLMIFTECWCLTLSSLFKHNVYGHEFNTSTENESNSGCDFEKWGHVCFVCVYICTLSPCWFVPLIWFVFFFNSEI